MSAAVTLPQHVSSATADWDIKKNLSLLICLLLFDLNDEHDFQYNHIKIHAHSRELGWCFYSFILMELGLFVLFEKIACNEDTFIQKSSMTTPYVIFLYMKHVKDGKKKQHMPP